MLRIAVCDDEEKQLNETAALPRTAAAEFKKAWGNYWLEEQLL